MAAIITPVDDPVMFRRNDDDVTITLANDAGRLAVDNDLKAAVEKGKWELLFDEKVFPFDLTLGLFKGYTPAKEWFVEIRDYLKHLAIGAKMVQLAGEREDIPVIQSTMRIIPLSKSDSDRGRYLALFKMPEDRQDTLAPGVKAFVNLRFGEDPRPGPWELRVIEPLAGLSPGFVTATLEKRVKRNSDEAYDKRTPPLINLPDLSAEELTMHILAHEETGVQGQIKPQSVPGIFPSVFAAFEKIRRKKIQHEVSGMDEAVHEFLIARRFDRIQRFDVYDTLVDKSLANPAGMGLNASQEEAIFLGRKAPAGFVICHGGPGTGKTHFLIEAIKPFLLDAPTDTSIQHRVLVTSATNRGADSLARAIDRQLRIRAAASPDAKDLYVVRMHSVKTEIAIALREGTIKRKKISGDRNAALFEAASSPSDPPSPRSDTVSTVYSSGTDISDAESAEIAVPEQGSILNHFKTFAGSKYEEVQDERVQNLDTALGTRIQRVVGLRADGTFEDNAPFPEFKQYYLRYCEGEEFLDDEWNDFTGQIHSVMDFALANAVAVCTTIAGAAMPKIMDSYSNAEMIVVDESARIPEYQWWPLLAEFPNAIGKIMVGDPDQLDPHYELEDTLKTIPWPFADQLKVSLQGRIQRRLVDLERPYNIFPASNFAPVFFRTQYRAVPEIASIYNNACYGGRLLDDSSTFVENRPLAKAVRDYNKEFFGVSRSVVFLDLYKAEERKSRSGSKFCQQYALTVVNILEGLLKAGFGTSKPCSIAILTPYKAQLKILSISKMLLANDYPQAADVSLETVDKVQGQEYDIVIVDPVVVKGPGFLRRNRLNVMLSRARVGLYVVGYYDRSPYSGWRWLSRDDSQDLRDFGKQLANFSTPWPRNKHINLKYFDGQNVPF